MNRKDRRRQEKLGRANAGGSPAPVFGADDALAMLAGRRPVVPPPPSPAPTVQPEALATTVQYRAADRLRGGRRPDTMAAAAAEAVRVAEDSWAAIGPMVEARKEPGFACAAGCAWCCHQQVAVSPAEAVAIARHVLASFPAEAREALQARLSALDERSRGLGVWGRARLKEPCAFLVQNRCSIYAVRPLRCRGVISRDVAACQWAMERPDEVHGHPERHNRPGPYPQEPAKIADAALAGLARATRDAGLAWDALELTAALRMALDDPALLDCYAAGEPVFTAALLPPRDNGAPAPAPGLAKPADSS